MSSEFRSSILGAWISLSRPLFTLSSALFSAVVASHEQWWPVSVSVSDADDVDLVLCIVHIYSPVFCWHITCTFLLVYCRIWLTWCWAVGRNISSAAQAGSLSLEGRGLVKAGSGCFGNLGAWFLTGHLWFACLVWWSDDWVDATAIAFWGVYLFYLWEVWELWSGTVWGLRSSLLWVCTFWLRLKFPPLHS